MKTIIFAIGVMLVLACNKKEETQKELFKKENAKEVSLKRENIRSETKDLDYSNYYKEAKQYCAKNHLNLNKFILIDLGVHSGLKRFFVYDFKTNAVSKSYIVSHGCGNNNWAGTGSKEDPQISNEFDSHCSSIGKFVVLNRGVSQWGIKVNYILQGKDKSNSNARKRAIVLHSWDAISGNEVFPEGTPEGWGCPAVSNESMKEIDELLKANKKVLMWIIKS